MFDKIVIANRGEIALRILRACRELGVKVVAVYSEADRNLKHVRLADESVCIGPAPSSESYLNIPALISAAEVTDAEANVIERIAKKAGVGGASREAMLEMALTSPKFLESQFRFLMRDSERAMKVLLLVAAADGVIAESERLLVTEFANRLEIDEERFRVLLRAAEQAADRATGEGEA